MYAQYVTNFSTGGKFLLFLNFMELDALDVCMYVCMYICIYYIPRIRANSISRRAT